MKKINLKNTTSLPKIYKNYKITLGPYAEIFNSSLEGNYAINAWSTVRHSNIKRHGAIGALSDISGCDIGKYSSISARCCIGRSNHPTNWLSTSEFQYRNSEQILFESLKDSSLKKWDSSERTKIGNDVWIGDSSVIFKGVSIGDGCIVAAGSVVTKNIDNYDIVGGNPAKKIKRRFPDNICEKLNKLEWWNNISFEDLEGIEFDNIEKAIWQIENILY